jgi:ABC-2 type transport system permease protein
MKHKLLVLIRRELWEHRSLWIAPLLVSGVLMLAVMFAKDGSGRGFSFRIGPPGPDVGATEVGAMMLIGTGLFLGAVAGLVALTYLLDCLYAERKDRSILFWKSLPVSDAQTVLAKVGVALVVVPLGVMLLALALQPILAAIIYLRFEIMRPAVSWPIMAGWPEGLGRLALTWIYALCWYLPVAAYLMLASLLARRLPLVHAVLPLVVISMWEWLFRDSTATSVRLFLQDRLFPWSRTSEVLLNVRIHDRWLEVFHDPALWVGVAVGAGMLYMVIRVRRYRDDT